MRYTQILLIDDDDDDQELFLSALTQVASSVTCKTANNGRVALEMLASKQVIPELIFLDLNMPIMNGQQFLHHIKNHPDLAAIPIIIFSTSADPRTIEETKKQGVRNFITKPDKFSRLKEVLHSVLLTDQQ